MMKLKNIKCCYDVTDKKVPFLKKINYRRNKG